MAGNHHSEQPQASAARSATLGAMATGLRFFIGLVLSLAIHAGIFWLWQQEPFQMPLFALKVGRGGTTGTPGLGSQASGAAARVPFGRFAQPARAVDVHQPTQDAARAEEAALAQAVGTVVKTVDAAPAAIARTPRLPEVERREAARAPTSVARAIAAAKNAPPSLAATQTLGAAFPRTTNAARTTGNSLLAAAAPPPAAGPGGLPGPPRLQVPGGNGGAGGDGGSQVDAMPSQAPANPRPPYPLEELRAGVEGVVTLRVLVAADGSVASAAVYTTSGAPRLDDQALRTVRGQWRFEPARRGGKAVAFEVLVPIVFTIVR